MFEDEGSIRDFYPYRSEIIKHIKVVPTSSFGVHERINKKKISALARSMDSNGYFVCPIPASHIEKPSSAVAKRERIKEISVVIDGMHRSASAHELDLRFTPIIDMVYLPSDAVKLFTWIRTLKKYREAQFRLGLAEFNDKMGGMDKPRLVKVSAEESRSIRSDISHGIYPSHLTITYGTEVYVPRTSLEDAFKTNTLNMYKGYCRRIESIFGIDKIFSGFQTAKQSIIDRMYDPAVEAEKISNLENPYVDFETIMHKHHHTKRLTFFPPLVEKKDVIKVAERNLISKAKNANLYPVHTTRHVLPFRVFGTMSSIKALSDRKGDAVALTKKLQKDLMKLPEKEVGYYPAGTTFDKRRYKVPTIIFNKSEMEELF